MPKDNLIPVIGLEIHFELATVSKMFCGCSSSHFSQPPNTQICPVCLGLPGALPVPNRQAVEWAILTGLSLNCRVNLLSKFDRKNYFYPDLPKGYQISQYDMPFCLEGKLGDIRIRRVHLEEDTAKLIHRQSASLIDFNRSGVPLVEIVTEPDLHDAQKAKTFLVKLQQKIRYLEISGCDMEKGTMRLEVNISLATSAEINAGRLPAYKVEIKNLNSFRFVEKAINFEISRQGRLLQTGQQPAQETRGWDEKSARTYSQRSKEEAKDYRYFPEPDIPPIRLRPSKLAELQKSLPAFPDQLSSGWQKHLSLSQTQADLLSANKKLAAYFQEAVLAAKKHNVEPVKIANLIINKKIDWQNITADKLVLSLVSGQKQTSLDEKSLTVFAKQIITTNPKAVADFCSGKPSAVEYLVGQLMKLTRGQSNPSQARNIILSLLKLKVSKK